MNFILHVGAINPCMTNYQVVTYQLLVVQQYIFLLASYLHSNKINGILRIVIKGINDLDRILKVETGKDKVLISYIVYKIFTNVILTGEIIQSYFTYKGLVIKSCTIVYFIGNFAEISLECMYIFTLCILQSRIKSLKNCLHSINENDLSKCRQIFIAQKTLFFQINKYYSLSFLFKTMKTLCCLLFVTEILFSRNTKNGSIYVNLLENLSLPTWVVFCVIELLVVIATVEWMCNKVIIKTVNKCTK